MKLLLSRSLFAAFLVVAGLASVYAQTTVTLPTIPCSNCNGPGAFATTAPACTPALVGAPLTMSWGTASGATSYTIMIATDVNMSQNVAAYTQTGTSLSVPAYALMPSTTYYWTVFANSAAGSTRATGGICSFITNTSWTGTSLTSEFPKGSPADQRIAQGIAGGYYTCQKGDGTCASGDNLLCNPLFQVINQSNPFVPDWTVGQNGYMYEAGGYVNPGNPGSSSLGVLLSGAGAGIPSTGVQTGVKTTIHVGGSQNYNMSQMLFINNTTSAPISFQVSAWFKGGPVTTSSQMALGFGSYGTAPSGAGTGWITTSNSWTQYVRTVSLPAASAIHYFTVGISVGASSAGTTGFLTDVRMCKL